MDSIWRGTIDWIQEVFQSRVPVAITYPQTSNPPRTHIRIKGERLLAAVYLPWQGSSAIQQRVRYLAVYSAGFITTQHAITGGSNYTRFSLSTVALQFH